MKNIRKKFNKNMTEVQVRIIKNKKFKKFDDKSVKKTTNENPFQ